MLLVDQLDHLLGSVSKIRILRFLIRTNAELNGREIAAAIGLSHVQCHAALKMLARHDMVVMRHAGKSILYRLNTDNLTVQKILIPLFEQETQLQETLRKIVTSSLKKPVPKSVILFGSFATGKARPDSDIDLLVIAAHKKDFPLLQEGLKTAEAHVTTGFGNHLAPLLMDEAEFKKRFKNRDQLIRTIVREGKMIIGDSINELLAHS